MSKVGVIGYSLLLVTYFILFFNNLQKKNLVIFGNLLLLFAYFLQANKYYLNKEDLYGNYLFLIFYILSFILPINEHIKITDAFLLLGHALIINNKEHKIGYLLVIIYYLYYIKSHLLYENYIELLQIIGASIIIYYYSSIVFTKHQVSDKKSHQD